MVMWMCDMCGMGFTKQLPMISGLGSVAGRLSDLKESCKDLPDCRNLITHYADKLHINIDFDKVGRSRHQPGDTHW